MSGAAPPPEHKFRTLWLLVTGLAALAAFSMIDLPTQPIDIVTVEPTPTPPVEPGTEAEDDALAELLRQLRDEDSLGTIDIRGSTCQQLNTEVAQRDAAVLAPVQAELRAMAAVEGAPALAQLVRRVEENAASAPLALYLAQQRLASVQLRSGALDGARQTLVQLESLGGGIDACYRADTAYIQGRAQDLAGQHSAARVLYRAAIELSPRHIPSHLRMIEAGLLARNDTERTMETIGSMLTIGPFVGARGYASDFARVFDVSSCEDEACLYLMAVLMQWANLDAKRTEALDHFDAYCRDQTCIQGFVTDVAEWRRELNERDAP